MYKKASHIKKIQVAVISYNPISLERSKNFLRIFNVLRVHKQLFYSKICVRIKKRYTITKLRTRLMSLIIKII